jgi:flavin-dependent dehydrogenase
VFSRRTFDGALLDAALDAGARLVPERVVDVAATPTGVEIQAGSERHRAAWLLGADGATSVVRRRLTRPFTRAQLSIATGVFAHGATGTGIAIACLADPPGYLWSFPRPDHLAVGIGAPADCGVGARALRALVRDWLDATGLAPGAPLEPYGWPIPSLAAADLEAEQAAGPRWMLLGDAAGLVDPLTREGIYFALRSGEWAAEAIAREPGHAARDYAARLRDEVYPELARAARSCDGFFDAPFLALMIDAVARSPRIAAVLVDLVAGRQPYRGLRRRLLRTREWAYAWRLARLRLGLGGGRAAAAVTHKSGLPSQTCHIRSEGYRGPGK